MALHKEKREYHSFYDENAWRDDDDDEFGIEDDDEPRSEWRRCHDLRGKFIGVELELEAAGGNSWEHIVDALPQHSEADGPPPDFEEDGSIDAYSGVEIIFPPIPPETLRSPRSYFNRAIRALHKAGVASPSLACGMHFNVNTNGWRNPKRAIFSALINTMPRAALQKLGGRSLTGYCHQYKGLPWESVSEYANFPDNQHSYACEYKGGRFECRFPGATTSIDVIKRLSFFVEFLEDFAEEMSVAGWHRRLRSYEVMYATFLQWLAGRNDANATSLAEFLTHAAE